MTSTEPITDPVVLRHAALDAIRANPNGWDQSAWRCETGMCFAGHVAQLAGGVFPYDANDFRLTRVDPNPDAAPVAHSQIVVSPEGLSSPIAIFARKMLKLDSGQADALFGGGNDLDDLEAMVDKLDAGIDIAYGWDDDDYDEGSGSL